MKITKIVFTLIVLWTVSDVFGQGGSLYSRNGIGDNIYTHSARRMGLGGLGFAAVDKDYLSSINPAGLYKLDLTRFEVGLNYDGMLLTDSKNSKYYSNYSFSGFTIGFPLQKDYGIVGSLGLLPVSTVSYNVKTNSVTASGAGQETTSSSFKYSGDGGLSKIFVGLTYKLPLNFILGGTFDYYTGKIDYNSTLEYYNDSQYGNLQYINKRSYYGAGGSLGLITSDLSSVFGSEKIENFKLAIYYNLGTNLTTDTSLTSVTSIGTIIKDKGIVETKVPYKIGVGASLTWNKNYLILVDYLYQPWSEYSFDGINSGSLKNLNKAVLSLEYSGDTRRIGTSFWDDIVLRGGFGYEQTQYEINGTRIETISAHAGFSFPLGLGNTIDLGFEYGIRGTTDSQLIKENILRANVSISFGELWFIRQDR
ncbi:MAG: outer membrane protein transport protein [Bacteroidetes bacterium]|nr:outer membrane protein transport protein [Bacteroidota bacterium]